MPPINQCSKQVTSPMIRRSENHQSREFGCTAISNTAILIFNLKNSPTDLADENEIANLKFRKKYIWFNNKLSETHGILNLVGDAGDP